MSESTRDLICPACGRRIQVPSELESFSCVYCGAKHRLSELPDQREPADEQDRAFAEAHLLDCVRCFPKQYKQFTKKRYPDSFREHRSVLEDAYMAMDRYICAQPMQRTELLEAFVTRFLQDWEDYHHAQKKGDSARKKLEFENKLTLAWYTVPAIRQMELSISEDYVNLLQQRFTERYPENIFTVGSYEEIVSGFRKHGFCFVTTAVCEAEGKPDDCPELTAFRAFRDGWLMESHGGETLISEYYALAPAIVAAMRYGDCESARCAELRRDYLTPCYESLRRGDNVACRDTYLAMVRSLQARYGLWDQ